MNSRPPTNSDNYHLRVHNFGPIAKAEIDLRPLTVFVGPSNTGKSYLAVLIYALHQCLADERRDLLGIGLFGSTSQRSMHDIDAPWEFWEALEKWALRGASNEPLGPLPEGIKGLIRSILEQPHGLERIVASEVARCFGVEELRDLQRRPGRADSLIEMRVAATDADEAGYDLRLRKTRAELLGVFDEIELPTLFSEDPDYPVFWHLKDILDDRGDESRRYRRMLLAHLAERQFRSMMKPMSARTHYLPADRTGIMHAHQVVVGTLVQSATTAGLRPSTHVPTLSGVLADFLNALIEIGSGDRRREVEPKLAEALESNVLGGSVRMDSSGTGYELWSKVVYG